MPVSAFKLDRALTSELQNNTAMQSVVLSLMALADNLDVEVIAAGSRSICPARSVIIEKSV